MEESTQDLILWTINKPTYKFEQVSNIKYEKGQIEFDYFGVSTQTRRHAIFHDIIGFSLKEA